MKKFWIIFKYEFARQVKNKVFIIITALFVLAASIGGFFIAKEVNSLTDTSLNPPIIETEPSKVYVYAQPEYEDYILQLNDTNIYSVEFVEKIEDLETIVIENDATGLIINSYTDITKIVSGTSLLSDLGQLDDVLNTMAQNKYLLDKGLSMDDIVNFHESKVMIQTVNVGIDGIIGFGYVYIYTILLYMAVMLFGSVISTSIISEKTSKAMELLITSADSTSLVAGKVFAVGISCIIQLFLVITTLIVSINMFLTSDLIGQVLSLLGDNLISILLLAAFLFIVGFFSILFLFAGFSSFGTKPEDANTLIMPLIVIILAVFMINMMSLGSDLLDSNVMKVLTYVPIVSPFIMFSRFALYGLSSFEIILGIVSNLLGAALLIWFAAKIYRAGTLHYGNSIKLKNVFRSVKSK